MNREKILSWLDGADTLESRTDFYDIIMMAAILVSMVPLMFKQHSLIFDIIDWIAAAIFIADYLLRWCTADIRSKKGVLAFFIYPFTPMAIIDLLSILPVFTALASGFRILRLTRFLRALRVIRVFKMLRYSRSCQMIREAIYGQRHALISSYLFAISYLFIAALLVFNVEPQTFATFWDAVYWAAISLTTVGYGDIYPVTPLGRCVTVLSSFVGIAIIALPSGIITAGYMAELEKARQEREKAKEEASRRADLP